MVAPTVDIQKLESIYAVMASYSPIPPIRPPILDSTQEAIVNENAAKTQTQTVENEGAASSDFDTDKIIVPGFKSLRDAVRRDLDVFRKYLELVEQSAAEKRSSGDSDSEVKLPSTNAPYLIAVWTVLLNVHSPVAIFKSVPIIPVPIAKRGGGKRNNDSQDEEEGAAESDEYAENDLDGATKTKSKKAKKNFRQQKVPGSYTKIDVVADAGRTWIRVNTIKTIRLLAEFREIDSYLTDSSDDESDSSKDKTLDPDYRPTLAQKRFDNSILRMGRQLIAAARVSAGLSPTTDTTNTVSSNIHIPKVILCLTRIELTPNVDPRIALTVKMLQEMGIVVKIGEEKPIQKAPDSTQSVKPRPVPTLRVNLDLSVLIALVSDLTHAELPARVEDVPARFMHTFEEHHRQKEVENNGPSKYELIYPRAAAARRQAEGSNSEKEDTVDEPDKILSSKSKAKPKAKDANSKPKPKPTPSGYGNGETEHTRALTTQLLQEMAFGGMLNDMKTNLAEASKESANPVSAVQFWTTAEARDRCLRIVAKIGGDREKRRVAVLFSSPNRSTAEADEAFWLDSRYPVRHVPLLPVRVYGQDVEDIADILRQKVEMKTNASDSFFAALESTCRGIIAQCRESSILKHDDNDHHNHRFKFNGESTITPSDDSIAPATIISQHTTIPKHTSIAKLTQHTAISLLYGAERRITTLTANRSSIKAVVKEMRVGRGFGVGGKGWQTADSENDENGHDAVDSGTRDAAAIWVVDPRSLAEGMRI